LLSGPFFGRACLFFARPLQVRMCRLYSQSSMIIGSRFARWPRKVAPADPSNSDARLPPSCPCTPK